MGRKGVTEKRKKGQKRQKKGVKTLVTKTEVFPADEMSSKKKSRYSRKFSVTAKIDMQAVTTDDNVTPEAKDGDVVLDVECGQNKALMFLSKLSQGSKGQCISFQGSWLTPNQFQYVSGRETAKDWKRSIRHNGKSIKLLMAKGILTVTEDSTCQNNEESDENCPLNSTSRLDRRLSTLENLDSSSREGNEDTSTTSSAPHSDVIGTDIANSDDKENFSLKENNAKSTEAANDFKGETNLEDNGNENDVEKWEGSSDTTEPVDYSSETLLERCDIDNECAYIMNECASANVTDLKTDENILKTTEINKKRNRKKIKKVTSKKRKREQSQSVVNENSAHVNENVVHGNKETDKNTGVQVDQGMDTLKNVENIAGDKSADCKEINLPKKRKLIDVQNGNATLVSKGKKRKRRKKVKNLPVAQKLDIVHNIPEEKDLATIKQNNIDNDLSEKAMLSEKATPISSPCENVIDEDEEKPSAEPEKEHETANTTEQEDKSEPNIQSNENDEVSEQNVSGPRESRLGSIINQLRENKEKGVGQKLSDVLAKLTQPSSTDELDDEENVKELTEIDIASSKERDEMGSSEMKPTSALREKMSRKHMQAKRSPYHMKKEANQKYLEIFEKSSDTPSDTPSSEEECSAKVESNDCCDKTESVVKATNSPHNITVNENDQQTVAEVTEMSTRVVEDVHRNTLECQKGVTLHSNHKNHQVEKAEDKTESHFTPLSLIPSSSSSPPSSASSSITAINSHKSSLEATGSDKQKIKEINIPSVKVQLASSPSEMPVFRDSQHSASPSRTCSPLSRKERILQSTGSVRSSKSPTSTHADNYNEYMKVLAATYGHHNLIPNPAIFDPFFSFRNPDISFHPGFMHSFMFPGYVGHKHHLPSMTMPPNVASWSKHNIPCKPEGSSVLDLSRSLPMTSTPVLPVKSSSFVSSNNLGTKRSSTEADNVLDLSVKRSRMNPSEITKVHTNRNRYSVDSHIHSKSHSKSSANTHSFVNAKYKNTEKYPQHNTKTFNKSWTTYSDTGKSERNKCQCEMNNARDIRNWSVERVCQFLSTLEGCASYVKVFLDHRITGKFLPYLTTEQLVRNLGMKIGPAMILCEAVTKKVLEMRKYSNPCDFCKTKQSTKITI